MKTEKKNEKVTALTLSTLTPAPGSHHRRKIVGRGVGSGHGRHATRGMKGQRSRRGDSKMIGFEGGQMPLLRRIPKRGFRHSAFRQRFAVVNVGSIEAAFEADSAVAPEDLRVRGLVRSKDPIKILGDGDLSKKLTVSAHAFSEIAKKKIIQAGGTCTVIASGAKQ